MSKKKYLTFEETKQLGKKLGVKWVNFNPEQLRTGIMMELEHGKVHTETNVTNDNIETTAKIALAHLYEFPDYYTRLEKMENEAEQYWNIKKLIKSNKLVL